MTKRKPCLPFFRQLVGPFRFKLSKNGQVIEKLCSVHISAFTSAYYSKAFPMEHWGIDWTAENATEYLQDFFEQKRFVGYVYEENSEVLGCIFALCKISGSKEEIYINEMAVLPERQGHGIGKQLLNAVKDYSKEKGLAGIVLYTSEYAPAAKFYEKNGFKLSNGTICMYCE